MDMAVNKNIAPLLVLPFKMQIEFHHKCIIKYDYGDNKHKKDSRNRISVDVP